MTTISEEATVCGVCREESRQYVIGSTSAFGAPDLDLRPPPVERDTLDIAIQKCPSCGYCAGDISLGEPAWRSFLDRRSYRLLATEESINDVSRRYLCAAHLARATGRMAEAGWLALRAAWACDDEGDESNGVRCRNQAYEVWIDARVNGDTFAGDADTEICIMADILRRAGRFSECVELFENHGDAQDEMLRGILVFESERALERDQRGFTVDDALGQTAI